MLLLSALPALNIAVDNFLCSFYLWMEEKHHDGAECSHLAHMFEISYTNDIEILLNRKTTKLMLAYFICE